MKRGVVSLLSVSGSLMFAVGSIALTAENPYQSIVDRNVFGLKPPPPKVDLAAEAAKQAPPNIFLTGITTVFGNKRALLKTAPTALKPGEKAVEQTYMLTEGQREDDLEVLQIDEQKGVVKIRLAGKEMDVDFEKNGVKITAAPAPMPGGPATLPGFPLRPAGSATPLPGATAQPLGLTTPSFRSSSTMPSRTQRVGVTGTPTGYAGGYVAPGLSASTPTGGSINLGGYSSGMSTTPQQNTPHPTVSPEEQLAIMAAEALANKNNPKYPPPPPPVAAVLGDGATTQNQGQNTANNMMPPMPPMPGRAMPLPQ